MADNRTANKSKPADEPQDEVVAPEMQANAEDGYASAWHEGRAGHEEGIADQQSDGGAKLVEEADTVDGNRRETEDGEQSAGTASNSNGDAAVSQLAQETVQEAMPTPQGGRGGRSGQGGSHIATRRNAGAGVLNSAHTPSAAVSTPALSAAPSPASALVQVEVLLHKPTKSAKLEAGQKSGAS